MTTLDICGKPFDNYDDVNKVPKNLYTLVDSVLIFLSTFSKVNFVITS
jgi:hypothetical protein